MLSRNRLLRTYAFAAFVSFGLGLPVVGFLERARAQEADAGFPPFAPAATTDAAQQPVAPPIAAPPEAKPINEAPRGVVANTVFQPYTVTPLDRARSGFGLIAIIVMCLLLSKNRRGVDWRLVAIGIGLQALFAGLFFGPPLISKALLTATFIAIILTRHLIARQVTGRARLAVNVVGFLMIPLAAGAAFDLVSLLRHETLHQEVIPSPQLAFQAANDGIVSLLDYANEGAAFLFASYVTGHFEVALVNFAFKVLPTIVFFSSFMAVLYHLGIMQIVIRAISWAMQRTMRTSGAETLSTAANIFVGQTEAPLLIRPFVADMTKSELLVVMAGGMANTAGGVLAAYVGMLYTFFPDIAGHLLAQSIMSAPAALVTSKIIWPEDGVPKTLGTARLDIPLVDKNVVEAAARGASEGLSLAFNVAAMLIAFIAMISMLDGGLAAVTGFVAHRLTASFGWTWPHAVTFQAVAGWLFVPFAWMMGTPTQDCAFVGQLLGQKIVLNEFVAYGTLQKALQSGAVPLTARGMLIVSYALSGFANFGSIGIQIGGIGGIAPERRGDIAALGILAMIAGSFATFMTACFAGMLA